MSKTILAIVVFAFALAASGVHKIAYGSDMAHAEIASMEQIVDAGIAHCCDSDEENAEVEKPRCLADNCLFSIVSIEKPYGDREKLRFVSSQSLIKLGPNEFLRPPIA